MQKTTKYMFCKQHNIIQAELDNQILGLLVGENKNVFVAYTKLKECKRMLLELKRIGITFDQLIAEHEGAELKNMVDDW